MRRSIIGLSILASASMLALSPFARAATIDYVGTQQDIEVHGDHTGSGWRVANNPVKTYDIDGDGIYGTDGYSLLGVSATYTSLPSYVSAITPGALPTYSSTGYAYINNPTVNDGTSIPSGTLYLNGSAPSTVEPFFTFTLAGTVPSTVRVGVLWDNTDNSAGLVNDFELTGGSGDSGIVSTTAGNLVPDWYFFDVTGGIAGETYTFDVINPSATNNFNLQLGGVAFDSHTSAVPEPASLSILGIGAAALLRRRRKLA